MRMNEQYCVCLFLIRIGKKIKIIVLRRPFKHALSQRPLIKALDYIYSL